MNIRFLGAARTVTGSKHLITTKSGKRLLLDCGLFQNKGSDNEELNRTFGFDPASLHYLFLSHAHIDHSGNIPGLVKQGYKGPVFCTPATYSLCTIMLADSARIQEGDVEYINRKRIQKGMEPLMPLYTVADMEACLKQFVTIPYNKPYQVDEDIDLLFTDVGHILGSAAVSLSVREGDRIYRIAFTGDIGRPGDQILNYPQPFPQADYLIAESTYGNRLHESMKDAEKKLLQIVVETCVIKKGKLIIPAFSLGRTQQIVYTLNRLRNEKKLPPINVYVDSPLATSATNITRAHLDCFNDEFRSYLAKDPEPFEFDGLYYIQNAEESKRLNTHKDPCIIISASGMMEAGRIKHHLKNNISNPANTILIVGYCAPGTLGGELMNGANRVRLFGKYYEVRVNVEVIGSYSAHGDYKEMMEYLSCQDKKQLKKIFLVHGEPDVQLTYREKLMGSGFHDIEIPAKDSLHELE